MSVSQFAEWMAYYAIEPFGQEPEYFRAGIIAATIANAHRGKKGRAFRPQDFMPSGMVEVKPKRQTAEEQKRIMMSIFEGFEKKGRGTRKKRTSQKGK